MLPTTAQRASVEKTACRKTFIVKFPSADAGAPILDATPSSPAYTLYANALSPESSLAEANIYYSFTSERDWKVGRWGKLRGPGSTALDELLAIEGVAERLALSFNTWRKLNKLVDTHLPPARPRFQRHEIVVAGEAFEVFFRDVLACIESLFSDPEFAPILLLVPERHYADADKTVRVYFDINTGKWWWSTQKQLEQEKPGATVVPVIISSDKTQLTTFRNKTAYPIYMTLGNLPKDVRCKPSRRGQILLAYLPTFRLLHIKNKAARRRTLANLFHTCMTRILAPLTSAGVNGMELVSGDGLIRRGHPILATYVGDYPEQVLVTGCKTGECPKCTIGRHEVGASHEPSQPLWDLGKVLDALAALDEGPRAFTSACREVKIKPISHPFWQDLPDLLAWIHEAYGTEEIDARCRRMPVNHSLRHFANGISHMSRVTGKEHQDISRILLGLVIGLPLPGGLSSARLVRATRALLDFLYLAQYPIHTTRTLDLLEEHLQAFHANKSIFVDLGIRTHFELPKLHSLDHYRCSIELFGTTDNYDTQYSERLHIDFTKDAYRATNKKDELTQMTKYIEWRLKQLNLISTGTASVPQDSVNVPPLPPVVDIPESSADYGASYFRDTLARYIVKTTNPALTVQQVEYESSPAPGTETRDVVHAPATRTTRRGTTLPGRFDTALIKVPIPVSNEPLARVRIVFKIPERGLQDLFPHIAHNKRPQHLAYVELFTDLDIKGIDHGLYKISPASNGQGQRLAVIIPVEDIERSCHLIPHFGPVAPHEGTSHNVLDKCTTLYLNSFADCNTYKLIY
ncbi:hypothetical protein BD309DRAFT_995194 [Dichomitus squalens]|uniref:Uncharacterized protein n=1 Tax=Dichomitus squalens TaxID=114155 RepID=A0A4V2K6I2_9APHY|nr:hypothetical protein BD309DRAFT_995194 [Dichomitus squalens]TBU52393.1 hypothetical protein BD310DRAFT_952754 [Dichomitus squalens]